MQETTISLEEVRAQLQMDGFTGLLFDGECGCTIDDLAPCGSCIKEDGEDYINGCDGGYKHQDPTRQDFWIISSRKAPPNQETFDRWWHECN